jgi:hypothetical protein
MRPAISKQARQRHGLRPRRRRRQQGATTAHERPLPEAPAVESPGPRPRGPEARERQAGGTQDQALFVCRCGSAFQAPVTASVRCPHCGESQAW